jgi:hypothetical protein
MLNIALMQYLGKKIKYLIHLKRNPPPYALRQKGVGEVAQGEVRDEFLYLSSRMKTPAAIAKTERI